MAGSIAVLEQVATHGWRHSALPPSGTALSGCAKCTDDTRYSQCLMRQLQFLTHAPCT